MSHPVWSEPEEDGSQHYDYDELYSRCNEFFPLVDYATLAELEAIKPGPELVEFCQEKAHDAYNKKQEELGDEIMKYALEMAERYKSVKRVNVV